MPAAPKAKRYQNISTLSTAVLRDNGRGEPISQPVAPRGIVTLTQDDVEMTKDRHSPRERNPFDMGLIVEIPAGKTEHPDAPPVPARFDASRIQQIMLEGTMAELEEQLARTQDTGHMLVFDRALMVTGKNMPEARLNQIEQLVTDRRAELARETERKGRQLDAMLKG